MISRQLLLSPLLFPSTGSSSLDVSNATNSMSPDDLKSRIFIGNLSTALTKRALHSVFTVYGQIKAISLHKGYAFIQYADEMDAINAVIAQDGQLLAGQVIDVNLVTSPKAHQKSAKRDSAKDSCDSNDSCDGISKKARVEGQSSVTFSGESPSMNVVTASESPSPCSSVSAPCQMDQLVDIMICGSCKTLFTNIAEFMQHKKVSCRLRFVCRCR